MANPVPFDPKNITANYSSSLKQLTVTANGPLPGNIASAELKRLELMGGRKFRLEGFSTGFGSNQPSILSKTYTENDLPGPLKFSKVFVVLLDPTSKKEMTAEIPIAVDAPALTPAVPSTVVPLKPQPMPSLPLKKETSALAAIGISLPAQNFVRITASVPDPALFRSTIEGRNEGDILYTWRAGQLPGQMFWDIAWEWSDPNAKPSTFTVVTSKSPIGPSNAPAQVTVQPYTVTLTPANGKPVDRFDPDA